MVTCGVSEISDDSSGVVCVTGVATPLVTGRENGNDNEAEQT